MVTKIMNITTAILAMASMAAAAPSKRQSNSSELSLTAKLTLADNSVDRYNLLTDKDFVYDFNNPTSLFADRKSFPPLVGQDAALALGSIRPCGLGPLHIHPRAAELFVALNGTVVTEFVPEGGVLTADGKPRVIRNTLSAGQMTVFPAGAFHIQMNPACEAVSILAAFSDEDPGAGLILAQVFTLDDEIISGVFGESIDGEDIDRIRKALPPFIGEAVDTCLDKCGLQKRQI
jgi:mannose-6-phosphate isomerase-like protein (cupin superfamily)